MNSNQIVKRVALAAGFLFLCAAPTLTRGQSSSATPMRTPHTASPTVRPKNDAVPQDDFAGLTFTPEQQAKIDQILEDFKKRMDIVSNDDKLSAEQKGAMLEGLRRMENGDVFKALTPEQQSEVRKKVLARRAAAKADQEKKSLPK